MVKTIVAAVYVLPLLDVAETTTPRTKTNMMMLTLAEPKNNQPPRMPLLFLDKRLHDGGPTCLPNPGPRASGPGGNNG